jgi:protein SCO1/2
MIRTPTALIPYLIAIAAVIGGLLWHAADQVPGLGRNVESGAAAVGGPFRLVDGEGRTRTDKDFHGRFLLVYFGYTRCPDVCPTTLAVMGDALDKLAATRGRIVPIFVTLDPDRDTPQVMKAYVKAFGVDFVGLTGKARDIAKMARAYRVSYAKHPLPGGGYSVDHTSIIYLMGPNGRFATYYDETIGPDALAVDLRKRL